MNTIEQHYKLTQSLEHRKKFGQFYTLDKIAKFMVEWLLEMRPSQIYDPAFGMGAFYNEVKAICPELPYIGREVDDFSYSFYCKNTRPTATLKLENQDYFDSWDEKYDAIVCNPPYLKFQKFENRHQVLDKLSDFIGEKVSGYTNTASAFLLKSIVELKDGGRLAYIMPLEFLNTGYGTQVKQKLLENGSIRKIIQITDEANAFDEVLTTICILFFEKNKSSNCVDFCKLTSVESMELDHCCTVDIQDLDPASKWGSYFEPANLKNVGIHQDFVPLAFYGKFKRGIATGDNKFFTLSKNDVRRLTLAPEDICHCITKSQQVGVPVFENKDFDNLVAGGESVYLFRPRIPVQSDSAREYIDYGEATEVHKRYLTRKRSPWYSVEKREVAPIWFGVFSRDGFKVIRNKSNCLNLTCYHGFVPDTLARKYIDKLFLFLKSETGIAMLNTQKRVYGNGLTKLEPNDLLSVSVPSMEWFDALPEEFVNSELRYLSEHGKLSGNAQAVFGKFHSLKISSVE